MRTLWIKWSGKWRSAIPRPALIGLNLLLAAALLFGYYVFRGCPDMNIEQAYRRAATRNLVGPGEILGVLELPDHGDYDRLLLAETEHGVIQFTCSQRNLGFIWGARTYSSFERDLIYREKEGPVTLMLAPGMYRWDDEEQKVPMVLFDDVPNAVRAKVEFRVTESGYGDLEGDFSLIADRTAGGYFAFGLTGDTEDERLFLYELSHMYWAGSSFEMRVPVQVRLYDIKGGLVYEGTAHFQSPSAAAHAKRNDT